VEEAGEGDNMALKEGEILYVYHTEDEYWQVKRVDRATGIVHHDQSGRVSNPDRLVWLLNKNA
jgi:hypothetical protein